LEGITVDWNAVGAIGEIAGAFAVVLTLIVLIRQVREGTRATVASTMDSLTARTYERLVMQATDEKLAGLIVRGDAATGLSQFDDVEAHQLRMWWLSLFTHFQVQFVQHGSGSVPLADLDYRRRVLVGDLKTSSIARECWEVTKSRFRPEFVEYVEQGLN
jgi:hypothetical protein